MYLRGNQSSVCPALLCNPRRNQSTCGATPFALRPSYSAIRNSVLESENTRDHVHLPAVRPLRRLTTVVKPSCRREYAQVTEVTRVQSHNSFPLKLSPGANTKCFLSRSSSEALLDRVAFRRIHLRFRINSRKLQEFHLGMSCQNSGRNARTVESPGRQKPSIPSLPFLSSSPLDEPASPY